MDRVPQEILLNACNDYYSNNDIEEAKNVLYCHAKTNRRSIKRKGCNKGKMNLADIFKVMLEVKLPISVRFVALDLSNLPPLSLDNVDTMKLFQQIESLKSTMKQICDNQTEMATIVEKSLCQKLIGKQMEGTKSTQSQTSVVSSADRPLFSAVVAGSTSVQKVILPAESSHTPVTEEMAYHSEVQAVQPKPLVENQTYTSESLETKRKSIPSADTSLCVASSTPASPLNSTTRYGVPSSDQASDADYITLSEWINSDDESNITVHGFNTKPVPHRVKTRIYTRSKPQFAQHYAVNKCKIQARNGHRKPYHDRDLSQLGRGNYSGLKAAPKEECPRTQTGNKRCIGVFLSRFDKHTSVEQIRKHVLMETGIHIKPELLPTRYDSYCSFLIQCDNPIRSTLLNLDIWPADVLVKPFIC